MLAAEAHTDRHPLQVLVSGRNIHVSEARGVKWAMCAAGLRCGLGENVEVFALDTEAGSLSLLGSYSGAQKTVPYLATWRDRVVVPDLSGVKIHRAQVTP